MDFEVALLEKTLPIAGEYKFNSSLPGFAYLDSLSGQELESKENETETETLETILDYKEKIEDTHQALNKFIKEDRKLHNYYEKTVTSQIFNQLLNQWPTSDFPYKKMLKGYSMCEDILAIEMATNGQNAVWMNLNQRQKTTLALTFDKVLVQKMIILINCPKDKIASYQKNWEFRERKKNEKRKKPRLEEELISYQLNTLRVQTHDSKTSSHSSRMIVRNGKKNGFRKIMPKTIWF